MRVFHSLEMSHEYIIFLLISFTKSTQTKQINICYGFN